ncbi:MAG: sulfide/dihydroorotate dehydrogenase-like FAD/NAD-binding protein [Ruminococcaceae bacterium]|nr:sulfide/dihydroorotate dehydrogenase-like FAD/NAD-binding protein [Oscillospiraceae bacterium]
MFKILTKKVLNHQVKLMEIQAPLIAKKAEPGQFIILRVDENGERIPLTIAAFDREKGTVTIIFQEVGMTTKLLGSLNEGDFILDFVGPLGVPTHLDGYKNVAVIGGGLGSAIAYPQAKKLFASGAKVDSILGFRNKDMIILEDEIKKVSTNVFITTDDGSNGCKGFVSDILKQRLEEEKYDLVIAIGPLMMMKVICDITRPLGIKTIVSMNPIMIDGTGMCGGCRVTVDGETKFACVDGPDFDGHLVDFESAMNRQKMYREEEAVSSDHKCRIGLGGNQRG